jgi:hypothetical protein
MPINSDMNKKEAQKMYDKEVARFAKRIAAAYSSDKIRLVTSRNARRAVVLHDIDAINDIIKDIPNMPAGFRSDFCDAFIGEDMAGLDLATPAILGYAYRAISARAAGGEPGQQERLDELATRIDDLSADFANSGGMVVRQNEWPLINMSNIANENEDFSIMLDARMSDVDNVKKSEMAKNKEHADTVAQNYDKAWNLDNLNPEDVDKLADRADEVYEVLHNAIIREGVMKKFAKVKMLDAKGRVIPQFTSGKRGEYDEYENYEPGFEILRDSRYESIAELVEHDIAKRYITDVNAEIDKDIIEDEFNETLLIKLYEIYVADRIVRGAAETPEQFDNPKFRKEFEKMLEPDGDGVEISDNGYNVAIETQTDATVGWFARLRRKIGGDGKKLEKLWKKLNRSLEHIDDMADVRMSRAAVERRKKRRNFAGRVLIGFTSSFVASAFITVSATAAAAKLGKSLALGSAYVGGGAALGIMGLQIARWIRNQKKNNLPVSWEEFKKNKQLVRSLMTSGLAIVAMVLSALGLAGVGMAVGIGAAALGAYNNGRGVFEAARDVKMSRRQRIAWTIANVASIIFGALGGKSFAQYGIAKYNQWNPDNTWFNNKTAVPGKLEKVSDEITHEKTIMHYPDKMLQSAKNAVEGWYAHDYPNHPEILQQDIDAVNQYNLDHDTNLDPYRILRAMKISQPSRLAYTPAWSDTYNVPQELISQAAHAVGGGVYDPAGMEAAKFLDANYLGKSGNIGDVPMGHTINKTYSPITELPTQTNETVIDQPARYESTGYDVRTEPVGVNAGYGAFGNYPKRDRTSFKTAAGDKIALLHDRVGSFLDRVRRNRQNESSSEDVTPVIRNDEPKNELPTFTLEEIQETQEQQLPSIFLDERDEESRIPEEKTTSPARREYVAPKISLDRVFPKPLFDDDKGRLAELREKSQPQPEPIPQWRIEDMPTALPDPENRKYEPLPDFAFALTEEQAERWNDLHKQLATVRAEMRNSFTRADKMLKLRKQANRLTNEINSFQNELGNPSTFEIEQALAEVDRRKKLENLLRQYKNHMRREPKGSDTQEWQHMKWETESQKLLDKIADLGGEASLNDSNLRFATPKLGRFEQKQAEVAQREMERQEQKRDVFVMPMREQPREKQILETEKQKVDVLPEPFTFEHEKPEFESRYNREKRFDIGNHTVPHVDVKSILKQANARQVSEHDQKPAEKRVEAPKPIEPLVKENNLGTVLETAVYKAKHDVDGVHDVPESLVRLAHCPDIISTPITEIRGVPVKLIDITGQNNPFTQNENRAMVIVDVDGLRIPFYLANGNEYGVTGNTGVWRPVLTLDSKGRWYINPSDYADSEELDDIIDALNTRIGDIRNYKDLVASSARRDAGYRGFVGGVDAVEQVDPNKILDIVSASAKTKDNFMVWSPYGNGGSWSAKSGILSRFLREVESPDYRPPRGIIGEGLERLGERMRRRFGWRDRGKKYE